MGDLRRREKKREKLWYKVCGDWSVDKAEKGKTSGIIDIFKSRKRKKGRKVGSIKAESSQVGKGCCRGKERKKVTVVAKK